MKWYKYIIIGMLLLVFSVVCHAAEKKIRVVTSTLDMADFVRQVGGDRVDVYAISKGKSDLHFFEPMPSQVMKLRKADMIVVGGLDVDVWVQNLINASRNSRIQFGKAGYVDPSAGVHPLDVPQGKIDGSMGDVHPYGNPHYWFTPENVQITVTNIYNGLVRVDPGSKEYYLRNKDRYIKKVLQTFAELKEKLAPYKGTPVIQYHPSWDYFCSAFGLKIIGSLEPKPGIPPTPSHLREIIATINQQTKPVLLFIEPYYPKKPVQFIQKQSDAIELRLPLYLGSKPEIKTYLDNVAFNVDQIADVLRKRE